MPFLLPNHNSVEALKEDKNVPKVNQSYQNLLAFAGDRMPTFTVFLCKKMFD